MIQTAILACIAQILTDLQIKGIDGMTKTTDIGLQQILLTAVTEHGHVQTAINDYLQQKGPESHQPCTAEQIQSIIKLCFID